MFGSNNAFLGGRTCALDRAKMLVGDPSAQQVCFQFSTSDGGLLPSDLDGSTITGTGASATHSTTVGLTVTPRPDFSISASPISLQESHNGGTTSTTVTVTPIGSFTGAVNLSVSGYPAGVTAVFTPTSVNNSGTSTLRLTSSNAPRGNYTVTITGTGPSSTHSTTVNLRLSKH
jgi:hypothetical protein